MQSNNTFLEIRIQCLFDCLIFVEKELPTLYWLPKLYKRPYKSRFIANSSACTTTELSILLTSCLTAIKNHVIKYCTTVYERIYR